MGTDRWFVLGFTPDDVVMAWQDARLARACTQAWSQAGYPPQFRVLQGPGDGRHLVYWFVNEDAVTLLDSSGVEWRRFLIEERPAPPPGAKSLLQMPDASKA